MKMVAGGGYILASPTLWMSVMGFGASFGIGLILGLATSSVFWDAGCKK